MNITSFEAAFEQVIRDDKGKELTYNGHIIATSPQYAIWKYSTPIKKTMFIQPNLITIVEPEIEQVIIKNIPSYFDFFTIIKHAKKITEDKYETIIKNVKYTIQTDKGLIKAVSYYDEFENFVKITFNEQIQNKIISKIIFKPFYPKDYDVISE